MSSVVALIRAVNIPGRTVRMAQLREGLTAQGYADVATYIQTGNVRLDAGDRAPESVADDVAEVVEQLCGYRPTVVLRTPAELTAACRAAETAPTVPGETKRYVTFLDSDPDPAGVPLLVGLSCAEVSVQVVGREVHWQRTSLTNPLPVSNERIERLLAARGTTRDLTVVRAMTLRWC